MNNNELGEKLKARRKERGLTLAELGELSGVDPTHLGRIEKGDRFPSARVLRKLCLPMGFDDTEIMKMAGYLAPDMIDDRITRFKESLKGEVRVSMDNLMEKIDTL